MINRIPLLLFIGLSFAQDITIAVLDFDGDGVSQSETRTLTNRLRDEMFNTGIYIVLERGKMDEVLKEQGFQQTGCVTSECAVEVGNMLGVQQMIGGSIGKVGNIHTVSARIIDVESGEVLKSANYDHIGDIGQLLISGMKAIAKQLAGIDGTFENIKSVDNSSSDSEIPEEIDSLILNEMLICIGIYKRSPIKPGREFSNNVDSLYCYTKISNSGKKQELQHIWYHNNREMTRVRYNIKPSFNYRSWSKKTIYPENIGDWRVDVVDEDGNVLGSRFFIITVSSSEL